MSSDVFQVSNGTPGNFNNGVVKVSFNGSFSHSVQAGQNTIGQLVQSLAQSKGYKAFTLYADGRKLYTEDASKPASSFKEIDIVAKDSRGRR